MARFNLFVLKVPLNANQPLDQPEEDLRSVLELRRSEDDLSDIRPTIPVRLCSVPLPPPPPPDVEVPSWAWLSIALADSPPHPTQQRSQGGYVFIGVCMSVLFVC